MTICKEPARKCFESLSVVLRPLGSVSCTIRRDAMVSKASATCIEEERAFECGRKHA